MLSKWMISTNILRFHFSLWTCSLGKVGKFYYQETFVRDFSKWLESHQSLKQTLAHHHQVAHPPDLSGDGHHLQDSLRIFIYIDILTYVEKGHLLHALSD